MVWQHYCRGDRGSQVLRQLTDETRRKAGFSRARRTAHPRKLKAVHFALFNDGKYPIARPITIQTASRDLGTSTLKRLIVLGRVAIIFSSLRLNLSALTG